MPRKTGKPYIYLRKDGRYEGRYRKYLSSDKKNSKQVSVYGATYEEALEKVLKGQADNSLFQQTEKASFFIKELMESWILEIKKTMKPSSYALYQSYAKKYLLPSIGDRDVADFDESALIALLESFQKGNKKGSSLAPNTIYILEEMVRSLFRYGAEKGLIPEVSFGKMKYKVPNERTTIALTEQEIQRLTHTIKQQEIDVQIQIMLPLYAGVSLSELCGLKWEDINLESGKIYIHRNLKRIQQIPKKKDRKEKAATLITEYELSEEECREFAMPEKLNGLLKAIAVEEKPTQGMYVAALHTGLSIEGKVSMGTLTVQTPPDGRTLQYRLKTVGEKAGISNLTFRTLRDTFAVMCLQAGGDAYSLAYVLGITVPAVCDRYQSWMVRKDGFLKEIG